MSDVVALTYDTLPAMSNLRREIDENGNLRISLAAGEPGMLARRAALSSTALVSVVWSILITSAAAAIPLPMFLTNRMLSPAMLATLLISVGVFFCAMFLLVWWLEYRKRMDEIERAALQMTVINASPAAVLIESVGPIGKVSKSITPPVDIYCAKMPGARIECVHVVAGDGEAHVFAGLSEQELHWIESEIYRAANRA